MKTKIEELTESLKASEGIDGSELVQTLDQLNFRWFCTDIDFNAAFYKLLKYGSDDVMTISPAVSDLREAFEQLEECCKNWKEFLATLLPPVEKS